MNRDDENTGFEQRLLDELLVEVRLRAHEAPDPAAAGPRWRRPRTLGLVGAVAAGAAAVAVVPVLLPGGDGAAPAFAVEREDDGSVFVEINDPDPGEIREALVRDLAQQGVSAVVDAVPLGQRCAQPRYETAAAPSGHAGLVELEYAQDGSDPRYRFRVDPGDWEEGDTLVVEMSEPPEEGEVEYAWMSVEVARGEVLPCEPVPVDMSGPEAVPHEEDLEFTEADPVPESGTEVVPDTGRSGDAGSE